MRMEIRAGGGRKLGKQVHPHSLLGRIASP